MFKKFKLTCCALLGAASFVIFTSQQQVPAQNPSTQQAPTLTSVNMSLADAISKIQHNLPVILHDYNQEGVAGGVAVYGITHSSSAAEPLLSVQFYHGSTTSNPSTTALLWNNAQAAASSANYSVAFPLVDKSNTIVGFVVVGSSSRPDLDQQTINKALMAVKGQNPSSAQQAKTMRTTRSFRR